MNPGRIAQRTHLYAESVASTAHRQSGFLHALDCIARHVCALKPRGLASICLFASSISESRQMDVLDLPQVWERPSYESLASALESLAIAPPVWNHRRRRSEILEAQESLASQHKAEATRYLSSIIGSPLDWIATDELRETLWDLASRRMSERCGRSAMGELTRSWPFEPVDAAPFTLAIKEPALTGDSLGFKTWGSSYVLARHLPVLATTSLSHLFLGEAPSVLELGSGTGLLGLAAAVQWGVPVALSDLPDIVGNLQANAALNKHVVESRGGSTVVGALTWGGKTDEVDQQLFGEPNKFKVSDFLSLRLG